MSRPEPRCPWCGDDPLYVSYHDDEWGRPERDRNRLFEMLCLEGAQAGLSWITVLRKRDGYRQAFHEFQPERVSEMKESDVGRLMNDAGIVRNRLKIESVIGNARALLALESGTQTYSEWLWSYVDNRPIVNTWQHMAQVPASTPLSDRIAKDLKRRGFRFVGTTIVYAYLQAIGMVNDHLTSCRCHPDFAAGPAQS